MTHPISRQYTQTLSSLSRAQQNLSHVQRSDASMACAVADPKIRDDSEISLPLFS